METLDSKIVELNNRHYLVYLKEVVVKKSKEGKQETVIRAFVKRVRLRKTRRRKLKWKNLVRLR